MKALLKLLIASLATVGSTQAKAPEACDNTTDNVDFELLSGPSQETVRKYFYATARLMQLINCIRQMRRAIDVDVVLSEFRQAEREYVWAGFRTIYPPSIQRLKEFKPADLARFQMLTRLEDDESPVMYSPAMDRHVTKLMMQYRAQELDSSNLDHLFKN
jgi:hypothetical protein